MKLPTEKIDIRMDELEQPLERVREPLGEDDYRKLKANATYFFILVSDRNSDTAAAAAAQ